MGRRHLAIRIGAPTLALALLAGAGAAYATSRDGDTGCGTPPKMTRGLGPGDSTTSATDAKTTPHNGPDCVPAVPAVPAQK